VGGAGRVLGVPVVPVTKPAPIEETEAPAQAA